MEQTPVTPKRFTLSFNPWHVLIVGLLVLVVGLQSYQILGGKDDEAERTINASGSATVEAEPDEFIFYPSFELKNADQAALKQQLEEKSEKVVNDLKALGVEDKSIKLNTYEGGIYYFDDLALQEDSQYSATVSPTITVGTRELAQKVQDYLSDSDASGSLSPQAQFSEAKTKELESEAKKQAVADAKQRAEELAGELGAKIGDVVSVTSLDQSFGIYPAYGRGEIALDSSVIPVQPGTNELTFSVEVVFELDDGWF